MTHHKGTGHFPAALYLFFILPLILSYPACESAAETGDGYAAELVELAKVRQLSSDRYWAILLHYQQGWLGYRSLVDDPQFFLAPDGKTNPAAELEATLKSFFQEQHPEGQQHPRCRFIARYTWLKDQLNIDEFRLPAAVCAKYAENMEKIKPVRAVLVFPGPFLNNPSSMFGHTFIKIDVGYESRLLAHAVNYAAIPGPAHALAYALKGLFGFYPGYYSIKPYYEKVKEYSDIDERDMWEYDLNLTSAEVSKMLLHIWEMQDIYSDYYFLDENCSYNILFLLEAARPAVHLTNNFPGWVIPIDTVRRAQEANLLADVAYRPSKATKIRYFIVGLDEEKQRTTLRIIDGEDDPNMVVESSLPIADKIRMLDLAAEFTQHRFLKKEISQEKYSEQFLSCLKARSRVEAPSGLPAALPIPTRPAEGHLSNRLDLGIGWHDQLHLFQELRYRPAYHDFLENDQGYTEGSQIKFAETTLRYYTDSATLRLESFDAINIMSISPVDKFFHPISWRVNTGLYRRSFRDDKEALAYSLSPGGGYARKIAPWGTVYLLGEAALDVSGKYDDSYAAGLGAVAGLLAKIGDRWKMQLSMGWLNFALGDKHDTFSFDLSQGISVSRNSGLRLSLSGEVTYDYWHGEYRASWDYYF
ncbi:MAG: DUF4105 domain-containing protein [Syntrophales bacterium]